jgi:tRNA-dihydrouridine synthase C
MLSPDEPAVILAPMEGVTDAPMRAVLGGTGAFTFGVSEFLRVSGTVLPAGVIRRDVPELRTGARTPTGMPVQVQLLGGDPGRVAESAVVAVGCGATAIDLNFGCPAKTVNRHDGGATLLKHPERIRAIVGAVRRAVPAAVPVSAKVRLGWDRIDDVFRNADMAAEGGASWLTVHARTRDQGYSPPVFWPHIEKVRERLGIPVVANGDIHNLAAFRRCREETGCRHFMLGRGAVADPYLAGRVAAELGLPGGRPDAPGTIDWPVWLRQFLEYSPHSGPGAVRRLKQWLRMAATFGSFAGFDAIKRTTSVEELFAYWGHAQAA